MVRTPPFHGGNTSSNLVGVTTLVERVNCDNPSIQWTHLYEIPIHINTPATEAKAGRYVQTRSYYGTTGNTYQRAQ